MCRSTGSAGNFSALIVIALIIIALIVFMSANQDGESVFAAGAAGSMQNLYDAAAVGGGVAVAGEDTIPHWNSSDLTYRVANCPADLDCAQAQQAVREAIEAWDRASGLTLDEVTSGGDIVVSWEAGDHGDGHRFDGIGGSLAHAAYPNGSGRYAIDGDVHLDAAEHWVVGTTVGRFPEQVHLKTVVMHEVGHALGLDHSRYPASLMWTTYSGIRTLTSSDIAAIQAIYGKPDPGEK